MSESTHEHPTQVATLAGVPLQRRFGIPLHIAHYTGGSYRTHFHSFLELIIVNRDFGHNVIAGRRTSFHRRQVFELGMFHPHRIEATGDDHCDYFNITFHPEVVAGSRASSDEVDPGDPRLAPFYSTVPIGAFLLPESDYVRAVAICESLLAETRRPDRHSAEIALGEFQALLGIVTRWRPETIEATDGRVQRVLRLIAERFDESLETRELASIVGVSPSRLAQLFRDVTGTTIRKALLRRRLTEAKRLLAMTNLPVTDLLHACGFNDISYFNRSFRCDTGMTPRAYRSAAVEPSIGPLHGSR